MKRTNFAFFSSIIGGLVLWALSPIRVAVSILPVSGSTSPVASSRGRRSINERSAWSTRFEFYNSESMVSRTVHHLLAAIKYQLLYSSLQLAFLQTFM